MSSKQDIHEYNSDEELWRELLLGNMNALSILYKRYYTPLFLYGKKLGDQPTLAEDSIQDLFYKIWKTRENLSRPTSIKAYIFKSFRRILLDKVISSRKLVSNSPPEKEQVVMSVQDLIITDNTEIEKLQKLKIAIEALPDRQKEIVYLRFFKEMDYKEIANVLDINYQSVRNSIHKALTHLRDTFLLVLLLFLTK